jgi:adenylate cyclase class 2
VPVEHEVKLEYESAEAARRAVTAAGGRLDVSRRLLDDQLYDTPEGRLAESRCALRLRLDGPHAILTFKGPPQSGPVKSREELETAMGDGSTSKAIIRALGFQPLFRAQKYREEFLIDEARVTVDETPIGVFVEIEARPDLIPVVAGRLGRSERDYRLESYPRLYRLWCEQRDVEPGDMLFE